MCHGTQEHHHGGCCQHAQACGCGTEFHQRRHFLTHEEKIARLEAYLQDLQAETEAVQEQIGALKRA